MRSPHNLPLLCLLAVLAAGRVSAAPTAAPGPAAPTSAAIPNYGGRDSAPLGASPAAPAQSGSSPGDGSAAAQAGRAAEALVLVLAGVVGVVYALKRFGLVQGGADGRPARVMLSGLGRLPAAAADSAVTVESSRTLPGGAMLHVVRVPGRTLLLAATAHAVTAIADWPVEAKRMEADGPQDADATAFEEYLARAEVPGAGLAAANARLRSLLPRPQPPKDNP